MHILELRMRKGRCILVEVHDRTGGVRKGASVQYAAATA